jgi:cyanophycinase
MTLRLCCLALCLAIFPAFACGQSYKYFRIGHPDDAHTHPRFGIAMIGGGADLDQAFRWLCAKADGGDFLVLRAAGSDDYNPYVAGLCKINSVATLIIPDRAAAQDARVSALIRSAEAVFIAGGDQARYVNFWKGTAVAEALDSDIVEGKPIAGTSAGLAVLGEFIYGALQDKADDQDLTSYQVLRDPYFYRVTLVRDFIHLPLLKNILTDSHFAKRDRMGRSLGFLARIVQDGWATNPREIAVDEKSAVLVEPDGSATVVGTGKGAYLLSVTRPPGQCAPGKPLVWEGVQVYRAPSGAKFDLNSWNPIAGNVDSYSLSVDGGKVRSSRGRIY